MISSMSSIARALNKFKAQYSSVPVGRRFYEVTDLFQGTRGRTVSGAIGRGAGVYALPLRGGRGMFEKWKLDSEGHFVRGEGGKPIIKAGPKQIVAELLCSPRTRFMGSDELVVGKEDKVQGIERERAEAVFGKLCLDPRKDAYVLFVRGKDQIERVVRIFGERLEAILSLGSKWRPDFRLRFRDGEDFLETIVGQMAGQVHPLIRSRFVAEILGPMLADEFIRKKVVPAIRKTSGKK